MKKLYFEDYVLKDQLTSIENYELAKKDKFNGWRCHHRYELTSDYKTLLTFQELKDRNLWYNRPAAELIFIPLTIHDRMHAIANGTEILSTVSTEHIITELDKKVSKSEINSALYKLYVSAGGNKSLEEFNK